MDDIKQEKERLLIREANSQNKEIIPVYKKDAVFNFFPDFRLHLERFKSNRIIFETNTGFIWNIDIGCFVNYLSDHAKRKKHPNYSIIAYFFSWLDNNEIIVLTTEMLQNNNRGAPVKYSIINDIIKGK
ncbi:hypothetical protein [Leadbettera azotonutricia]|uniref:Uncharacterized protein n=1 Tax=Leadbettera azotonutricia (strain ATCC BAA-888 / DSM 13862 / ZAS-9) TaxID=545695 RepID=F5YDH0_LEAAZ|nr:hypothetical protein [Leadbettera azotonutricia]AEF82264.1 hypothetical protein TREAZ_0358 [Leadbettera azotonutricia ZAS-9]